MNAQDEQHDVVESTAYNPFPEPQTIPSGWDLSELPSISENDVEIATDSSTDI